MAGHCEHREHSDSTKAEHFFISQVTIGFAKETLLHGVS